MRFYSAALLLLISFSVHAQDCVDCTKHGKPAIYVPKQGPETALSQQLEKILEKVEKDQTGNLNVGFELNAGHWVLDHASSDKIEATHHTWNEGKYAEYGFINQDINAPTPGTPSEIYVNLYKLATSSFPDSQYSATNSDQFMQVVGTQAKALPLELQLQLLKSYGSILDAAYDKNIAPDLSWNPGSWLKNINGAVADRSDDDIFTRMRSNEGSVGVCRHIHRYLRDIAQQMGLEAYTITVDWKQKGSSGGHLLSAFKDPKSGKVFIQNYSTIIEIGQTNEKSPRPLQETVTRIFSGSSGVSIADDGKNSTHTYLTDTGKLMLSGIEKADQLVVHPHQDVAIKVEQQNGYSGGFAKIPLEKKTYRSQSGEKYLLLGGQDLQNHPTLPTFKQGFIGYGQKDNYEGPLHSESRWRVVESNQFNTGIQSFTREQAQVSDYDRNEKPFQSEQFGFLNFGLKTEFKLPSLDQKKTLHIGNEMEFRWSDFLNLNNSKGDLTHSAPFYNWIRPYVAVSKKISEKTGVGFQVSDVIQYSVTNPSKTKLGLQHQFFTGEVEVFHAGKDLFVRANEKLYVMPGAGVSHRSSLELMQSIVKGKKAQLLVVGTGSLGANLKDSDDKWYALKPYQTGRAELQYSRKMKQGLGVMQVGGGIQYQGNTSTNTFDPLEMKNVQQFIENPQGRSMFFYWRFKI